MITNKVTLWGIQLLTRLNSILYFNIFSICEMKLAGNVQVTHRLNPSARASQPRWSNLAIGKDANSGELYLSCHSSLTNSKYKILGNIEQVFTKFIGKGMATIRFREPAHDFGINCKENVEGLKSFLIALRRVLQQQPIAVPLSSLTPTGPIVQKPKKSMTITERSAYPIISGFPGTLETLSLNLQMERFDRRIVRLSHLKTLNLSDNRISVLPKELGELPCLSTLNLSGNRLGQAIDEESNWSWMDSLCMSSKLYDLDLTANELQQLPANFNNLRSLVILKLDENALISLPQMIGNFSQLKYLGASRNKLTHLPGSFSRLRLDSTDISGNPFAKDSEPPLPNEDAISNPPSLFENAARTIVNKRIFYPKQMVPKILQNYINSAQVCLCGSACFESRVTVLASIDLRRVSPIVVIDENVYVERVPAELHFCSKKCLLLLFTRSRGIQRRRPAPVAWTQPSLMLRTGRADNIETPWMNDFIHQYRSN